MKANLIGKKWCGTGGRVWECVEYVPPGRIRCVAKRRTASGFVVTSVGEFQVAGTDETVERDNRVVFWLARKSGGVWKFEEAYDAKVDAEKAAKFYRKEYRQKVVVLETSGVNRHEALIAAVG